MTQSQIAPTEGVRFLAILVAVFFFGVALARAGDEPAPAGGAAGAQPAAPPPAAAAAPQAIPVPAGEPEEPRPTAGYDSKIGGFFLQSKDGKFLLKLNARIQARYTYFGKDEFQGDEGRDESYFEVERARIGLSGHLFDPSLLYKVEIDAETDGSDKGSLSDAYIQYAPCKYFAIGAGQFKPAFIREEITSSAKFQRVERSLANEFFNIDRNIGAWVEGDITKNWYYNLAVTNGIDTVNQAPGGGSTQVLDQPPALVGKLDWIVLGDRKYSYEESDLKGLKDPLLAFGSSFVWEQYNESLGEIKDGKATAGFVDAKGQVYSFCIDGTFKYQGFSILGEYIGRWYDQDGPVTTTGTPSVPRSDALYAHGFTVQGGYFISRSPDIEITGRFSAVYGNEGPQKGTGYEIGPGINWFFSKSHNGKLQLDVAWVELDSDLPSPTEYLRQGPNKTFSTTAAGFAEGEQGVLTRVQVQLSF